MIKEGWLNETIQPTSRISDLNKKLPNSDNQQKLEDAKQTESSKKLLDDFLNKCVVEKSEISNPNEFVSH